ncbi:hypothetical protein IQ06DRAFT_290570 [Phaeosphaeriaceae sp. SRC1lsM3a]|nr:hypothetical protein IQ06DRAFT_290570 [Stagonospora sp. SRC1lsM3a]
MHGLGKTDRYGQTPLMAARRNAGGKVDDYLEPLHGGDEHIVQVEEIVEREDMCGGEDGSSAFGDCTVWRKRFAIVLMTLVGLLVYPVQYSSQRHESSPVVDY